MSGAAIIVTTEVLDKPVRRAFKKLSGAMRNTTPIMAAIGTGIVGSTHQRFVSQTEPSGNSWQALNPEYAAGKRNSRILTESGRLRDSISSRPGRDEVEIGTNVIYAGPHQHGAVITPKNGTHLIFKIGGRTVGAKSVTIPARPFLGVSSDDRTMIAEIVFGFLKRVFKR
ncbi:MAG: phage virion morphogenesis protein [Hyphomicrobiales bacterium]|nr:MAG: phage virion morphogenesis protein [Hyphomicrobiales bacterium]